MARKKVEQVEIEQESAPEQETTPATATRRAAPEVETVTMQDGRTVEFKGRTRVLKDVIFGTDDNGVQRVGVQFDFRNGQTLVAWVPEQHLLYSAGHGYKQRLADDTAGSKDEDGNPISDEDRFLATEALHNYLQGSTDWNRIGERGSSDSVSGAGFVLKALVEVSGKTLEEVKKQIDARLAANEARWEAGGKVGPKPTRRQLYKIFRQPDSRTGKIIARLEAEAAAKGAPQVLADDELEALGLVG